MRSLANREVLLAVVLCLFAAVFPIQLVGQIAGTASISGRITDATGAAIPAATVTLRNTATSATQTQTTDEQGRYLMPDLPIGPYEVTASKQGFQTSVRRGVTLTVGSAPVIDFQLAVGQASQSVNVTGEAAQVQTTSAEVSSVVNQTQMRELPLNGRNFEQLILLAPGVSTYPQGGSSALTSVANAYSISGTRPEGYANLLDGEDVLNWWQRNAGGDVTGTSLGIEGIAEFQTLTNTYGAQYGGNGAVVNAVSKSGTNDFHGSAYEFFRNSDLDSRGFFDGPSPPPFHRNQYGASFGGPIKKNKVFFFVNYEGIRQILDTTNPTFVPSAEMHQGIVYNGTNTPTTVAVNPAAAAMLALYPLPTASTSNPDVGLINEISSQNSPESFGLVRIDWNISDKDALFVRYEADFGNRTTYGGPNSLNYWPTLDQTHNQFFTVGERHIFSPDLISQFTTSYSRPVTGEVQPTTIPNSPLSLFTPTREDATISLPDGMAGLGAAFINPFNYLQDKFTNSENIDWIHGSHDIKFGLWERREDDNVYAYTFWNGWYLFASTLNFLQGNPLLFEGAPNGGTNANRYERTISLEPYIQDDWKVNNRLTINLGLRYEWESNPIENGNNFYNLVGPPFGTGYTNVPHAFVTNPSNHNFDPRVGLAWDVFGDHKTSVRAGFGIFHDVYQTYTFSSAYTSNPPFLTELNIYPFGYPCFPTPFASACAADSIGGGLSQTNGTYYGTTTTPYTIEYNFNIQRELPWNTLLTVGYVGTRGDHLLAFHDFNPPVPNVINGVDYFATNGVQNQRIDPNLGSLDMTDPSSSSSYNALEVSVEHKLSSSFVMQLSYTYSHCLDYAYTYGGLGFNNVTSAITNPYDWNADYGNCSFDLRHVISANVVYLLPFHGNRLKEGWQISGIQSWHTGVPFSLGEGDQADLGNTFDTERPNVIAGCNVYANQTIQQWYNPACFTPSPYGTVGDLGRNQMVGPGFVETDLGILKSTRLNERFTLEFRAELFNLFNHPNFDVPNETVFNAGSFTTGFMATPNATAGQITDLVGAGGLSNIARQTQFSLKLIF